MNDKNVMLEISKEDARKVLDALGLLQGNHAFEPMNIIVNLKPVDPKKK